MKITKIKALCRTAKKCIIYHDGDRQYIGTTDAIYPADNLKLTPASVATLFDMPDALDALRIEESHLHAYDIAPVRESRAPNLREGGVINYLGEVLYALVDDVSGSVLWVQADYIKAAEYTEGYRMYRLAENKHEEPLIVIKDGLLVIGVVKPIPKRTAESISGMLDALSNLCPMGSPNQGGGEAKEAEQIDGQMSMEDVDEAFGLLEEE